jgi:integrase
MKRGNITKRGKNSWQLKFDAPAIDGKRVQRYATVRGSYQDAQKELTRLLGDRDTGKLADPVSDTVEVYLRTFLHSLHSVSPKTRERYTELSERQIIPHLGAEKIRYLTAVQVGAWHGTLLRTGLSPQTVVHAHRVLARALRKIKNTAALDVDLPVIEDAEIEILEPGQIAAVLAALEGHGLYPIVALALATGMRRGELLGLQWGDVDLDAGTLRVERSLEETKAGLRLKPPKTKRGRRTVTLDEKTVATMRAHKVKMLEVRLALGQGNIATETLVFGTIEGEPMRPRNLSKAWWRVVRAKGLPQVSFHSLRHSHASLLIRAGLDILPISRRLGHSKAAITLDRYGHLIGGADEAAALAIGRLLK